MHASGKGVAALVLGAALLACSLAAPLSAAAAPSAAIAAKDAKKKSPRVLTRVGAATTTSAINTSAIATCPKRTRLVGGGFATELVFSGGGTADAYLVSESRRLSPTEWIVTGLRADGGPPGNAVALTSYAQCRRLAKRSGKRGGKAKAAKTKRRSRFAVTERSASTTVGTPGAAGTATARCPRGRRAIAGGFSTGVNTFGAFINLGLPAESFRSSEEEWTATMLLFSPLTRTVTSYAYCARAKPKERGGDATLPAAPGSIASAESRRCPRGRRLGGGGYRLPIPSPSMPAFVVPVESRPGDSGWRTTASQSSDGVATTISSYGFCL